MALIADPAPSSSVVEALPQARDAETAAAASAMEPKEPMEPMEPMEPIERMEPRERMERMEPAKPAEPAPPASGAEPVAPAQAAEPAPSGAVAASAPEIVQHRVIEAPAASDSSVKGGVDLQAAAVGPAGMRSPVAAPALEPPAPTEAPVRVEPPPPTGRPGPYVDHSADLPEFTDEEIERIGGTRRTHRVATTFVMLGAALAAFATGLVVFNNMIMPQFIHGSAEVQVPDLSNLNVDQAEQALRPLGLVLSRAGERFDPSVPRGFVLSQDPPAETPVRGRKRVMVIVSLGEEFSSVPSLFGESLRSARFLLQRSGLRVTGITHAPSDEVGDGLVAGTDPPPETVLPRNASVSLLVSAGSGPEQYVMPDLLGREVGGVRRRLESLGFKVTLPPVGASVGAIVFQDPAPGSRITIDTPVNLQATGRVIR